MQAVILAGGLGTRLRPITETVPKPMVSVAGVPYLEHQLRLLDRQGVRDIVLLVGYLGEQIQSYFGDGGRMGLSIRYSCEPEPLGTGGALRLAIDLLADSFLLIYGDSYLPVDYRKIAQDLDIPRTLGVVAVYDNRLGDTSVRNNIAIDQDHYVTCYAKIPSASVSLDYVEAGVMALKREVTGQIPPGGKVSLEEEVLPSLIERRLLRAYSTGQRFYDIGTLQRLEAIENFFAYDHHSDAFSY